MKRRHKVYARPKKLYDSVRIKAENKLVAKYGLKNKKEIWKTQGKVNYYRSRGKSLITAGADIQKGFFENLNQIGLKISSISDVLALGTEDILKRRLASIVASKGIASTPKQARQMIAHKRILVAGRVVNVPGYLVKVEEEQDISLKQKAPKIKKSALAEGDKIESQVSEEEQNNE